MKTLGSVSSGPGTGSVLSTYTVVFALILFLLAPRPVSAEHLNLIFRVANLGQLSLDKLVEELRDVRVVVVGEQHDNRLHHQAQLAIIQALHETGQDIAIGFEQFASRSQPSLDKWVSREADVEELFRVYSGDWELSWWNLYEPIFLYAREHQIPMVGLNVPREIVRQVARRGFASLTPEQRGDIRMLSCDIDTRYQETLARVLGQKGRDSGGKMFTRFCEAQVVRDTTMALNSIDYLKDNPGKKLVILAGNFHAWKRGIAEQIRRRDEDLPVKTILPSDDASFMNYGIVLEDSDYVWWLVRDP